MDAGQLLGQAQLLFVEGKDRESIEVFTKALEAGADPYIVHLSRAVAFLRLKETEKALEDLNRALEINDESARAFYYRGLVLMAKEDYEKAVADFTRALELKPDLFTAKFARSTAYIRLNDFEKAASDMKSVLPKMQENLQIFADRYGILRTEMGKVAELISSGRPFASLQLTEEEIETLKKWLTLEQ